MDSYDKFLSDIGCYNINYLNVKKDDQRGVNDYINLMLFFEEYVNSVAVYTDLWLSTVMECDGSPMCSYDSCVVNGHKYYIMVGIGD